MKNFNKNLRKASVLFAFAMVASLLIISGCKKEDPLPEVERIKTLLAANTWRVQSVVVDGVNQNNLFTGLTLSFTATNYSTTNGGLVWPASGTWLFKDDTGKTILRSDGLEITLEDVTETTLKLSLNRAGGTLGKGRSQSVAGKHVFTFVK